MSYNPYLSKPGSDEDIAWRKENNQYPYWKNEFDEEFEGYSVIYNEGPKPSHKYSDEADSYRVFMILCNNNWEKNRMEVLKMLKEATFERPIQIDNEWFWTEANS